MKKLILAITLFVLASVSASAQQIQAKLSHYSTDDGLSSNAIARIVQDDWGYVWLATWNGLSRFDGYNFYNYRTGTLSHIPNLHNRILQIVVDNQQNIWMRMYDNRIFVVKRSIDRIINPFEKISDSEEFRTTRDIVVTSAGDVLVTIDDMGIYKMRIEGDDVSSQLITTAQLTVTSMAEGYQNDIWLGTDSGIHRMDASNMTIERKGLFLDEYITCLYSNGYNIFAGTRSGKIVSFAYGQDPVEVRHGGDEITALFVDSRNMIWFADTKIGAYCIDQETGVERRFVQDVRVPDYDGGGARFSETNGIVWVLMNHGGFGYYNREKQEVEYFHNDPTNPWNLSNTCNAYLALNEGVVWESTNRRGLEKLEIMNKNIERRMLVPNATTLLDNEIRGMCYDPSRKLLLIANKNNALFAISPDGSHTVYSSDDKGHPIGRIYGISMDAKNNIWLSSKDHGLFKMSGKPGGGFSLTNYCHDDNDIQSLSDDRAYQTVEDADGNIWVATYGGGVNVLVKGSNSFLSPKNKMKDYPRNSYMKVRTIALDKDGKVWAGTTDGILIMSIEKGNVVVEKLAQSEDEPDAILMSNDIVCLARDNHGMMWVGTNGGGLGHTTGKDSNGNWLFENFGSKDGLPAEEILSITFDKRGSVWFATEHILCSFDTGKRIFTTLSTLEGVDETMCSEGSAISLPDGKILFGTISGYYIVDRNKLVNSNAAMLKLRFTDFWLDEELQSPRKTSIYDYYVPDSREVKLPSHSSSFSIRFASLNYQLQHRVHYQYKLEGYDRDWINATKDRIAAYSNLPAGTFKLIVRAFLLESPEKYDQKEISITVPPPFLFSTSATWFYMLLVAAVSLLLLFWRQKQLTMQTKKKYKTTAQSAYADRHPEEQEMMDQFEAWMEKRYAIHDLTLDEFLASIQMNRANFEESLKRITGLTPREFISNYRIDKAKQQLEQTNDTVADISFRCGFADAAQFNRLFASKTGMTPSQFRDQQRHATGDTDAYVIIE